MQRSKSIILVIAVIGLALNAGSCAEEGGKSQVTEEAELTAMNKWKIHDPERPLPPVVDPGPYSGPAAPPSDAVVLFGGTDLSAWENAEGGPAGWTVENGYMEVKKEAGSIQTKIGFGDCQLHVEWMAPLPAEGDSQDRGNSGVFLMQKYEIQVLDNFNNTTYADGMAGAVYGQYPPMVNTCRPPGEWQTYDIVFRRPRFEENGEILEKAVFTVFHNGVMIQDHVQPTGPTEWKKRPPYSKHPDRMPISLQNHGNPVRFRNIWIRELE